MSGQTSEQGADRLVSKITRAGVRKGQILWIDAHSTGSNLSGGTLVVYWEDRFETTEDTGTIKYNFQDSMNIKNPWDSI